MTDLPTGLTPHARGIAEWFRMQGRVRFTPTDLRAAVAAVSPASSGTSDRPRIVLDALEELEQAAVVALSEKREVKHPHLPTRVTLLLPARLGRVSQVPEPWHPLMHPVATPRPPGTTLGKINTWVFRHRSTAVREPLRERSLEITGDEKALDRIAPGIDSERLDEVLLTYPIEVPLHRRQRVGDGPVLLVIENLTTFDSIGRVLRAAPGGPIGEIAWGAGGEFQSSVLSLCDDPPPAIRYFGDLDADGLRIPAAASVVAERAGLPPVRPATGLYDLLVFRGRRQDRAAVKSTRAQALAGWLESIHKDAAIGLLTGGGRYAQEACRRSILTADDTWRSELGTL